MVTWTKPAAADLRAIHSYIAHDSPHYARKVARDIREKVERLAMLPKIGRKVPEVDDETIREIPLYSYRIIYQTGHESVFILARSLDVLMGRIREAIELCIEAEAWSHLR